MVGSSGIQSPSLRFPLYSYWRRQSDTPNDDWLSNNEWVEIRSVTPRKSFSPRTRTLKISDFRLWVSFIGSCSVTLLHKVSVVSSPLNFFLFIYLFFTTVPFETPSLPVTSSLDRQPHPVHPWTLSRDRLSHELYKTFEVTLDSRRTLLTTPRPSSLWLLTSRPVSATVFRDSTPHLKSKLRRPGNFRRWELPFWTTFSSQDLKTHFLLIVVSPEKTLKTTRGS